MCKIKFSIITVTYNAEKTLEDTIKSVLSQKNVLIEYIIVDGKSTDSTIDIIKKYNNIIYVSERDSGIYDAMNKGLKIATGNFVLFMGADDIFYSSDVLEKVEQKIKKYDVVYYGNVLWKGTNHIHWGKFNKLKWAWSNISHQAIFYPQIVYKNYKYNLDYKIYSDNAYNLTLLKNSVKFEYLDLLITLYNMDGISSHVKDLNFERDRGKMVYQALGFFPTLLFFIHQLLIRFKNILHD